MKKAGEFRTYEQANVHQEKLIADGIDATIEYRPAGLADLPDSRPSHYVLLVEDERFEDARAVIEEDTPPPSTDELPLLHCPHCRSPNVQEKELSLMFFMGGALLLGVPLILHYINLRVKGARYRCLNCARDFRRRLGAKAPASQ